MKIRPFYIVPPQDWWFPSHPVVAEYRKLAVENPRKNQDELEEYVRQWALRELVETYGYPKEWLGERIAIEEPVTVASTTKEADVAVKNERGRPFLYVETKASGISHDEYRKAERQLETYLSATHTATVGMVTDGTPSRTRVIVKKVDPNDFDYIPDIPEYKIGKLREVNRLVKEVPTPTTGRATGLKLIMENFESILFEAHSAIRDIDGRHDDEALDELVKLIYAKMYDERQVSKAPEGTPFRFQAYGGNVEEVASNIRDLYEEARESDSALFAASIPDYEGSRGVFKEPIKLSSAALYEVVTKLQDYTLIDSRLDVKGRAIQKVLSSAMRAGMGQYFTPDQVVRLAVGIAAPKVTDFILDPFCGSAHFLTTCYDYIANNGESRQKTDTLDKFRFHNLHGIDKSERMVRIAVADMMLHEMGYVNIRHQDALLTFDNYPDITEMSADKKNPAVFDLILTNPPFGSIMKEEARRVLGRFALGHKKRSLPLEVLALERCFQFLKPGGKLGIVLPDGILANRNLKFVRNWYRNEARLIAVVSLPEHTFTPFGSMVKTSLVFFKKRASGEKTEPKPEASGQTALVAERGDIDESYQVYMARIEGEEIGYDPTGRPTGKDVVQDVVLDFHRKLGW